MSRQGWPTVSWPCRRWITDVTSVTGSGSLIDSVGGSRFSPPSVTRYSTSWKPVSKGACEMYFLMRVWGLDGSQSKVKG